MVETWFIWYGHLSHNRNLYIWHTLSFESEFMTTQQNGQFIQVWTMAQNWGLQFHNTTGWSLTYPSEKSEFVSWDDDIPNWMENHKNHVWNHQPDILPYKSIKHLQYWEKKPITSIPAEQPQWLWWCPYSLGSRVGHGSPWITGPCGPWVTTHNWWSFA